MLRLSLIAVALLVSQSGQQVLTLEIRAFRGTEDVTAETRMTVHRAGDRAQAVAQVAVGGPRTMTVPPGIYDAQAVHERDKRVVAIRWAERLVVMPYPDEAGHHLEIVNFTPGFGALQVRAATGRKPDAELALFAPQDRTRPAAQATWHDMYALFVVPAGRYDVQVKRRAEPTWHTIDVPLDRTRLWIVP